MAPRKSESEQSLLRGGLQLHMAVDTMQKATQYLSEDGCEREGQLKIKVLWDKDSCHSVAVQEPELCVWTAHLE